ncbi:hypothetical protein ABFS82_13G163900 [Erythranthe guttata]|uniref:Uncharacterized protein n=1 Tax=Erythranthe guttata TaxID=4155 RepID=A0A022QID9_ERYGU|nr:PREDICTED: uncharacterized protein LOC105969091 [Erythranthe guttata]EYU27384.1 hypothetical protein MIMGU_mgv1a014755mg [Erythranthe guttata]|eukprot:XP_012849280.1 PREDICTED: uncharacterized protein LOC105969091 [Erythranthe guttata]
MEGVGSRQSRASARYAASPSAPVFNGPVRRWKKQWVTSQTNGSGGGGNNNRKNPPPLLLCRWTPLSSSTADEPPRRRFRYAPIVPIERGNMKTLEKDSNGGRRTGITTTTTQTNNGSDIVSESDAITLSEKPSNGEEEEEEEALEPNEDQADSNKAPFHGFYPRDEKRTESNEGRKMMS